MFLDVPFILFMNGPAHVFLVLLNPHDNVFSRASGLIFCQSLSLLSYFLHAISEDSFETAYVLANAISSKTSCAGPNDDL